MNQIWLLESDHLRENAYIIQDSFRLTHMLKVLKVKKMQQLKVFKLNGPQTVATITEITHNGISLQVYQWATPIDHTPIKLMIGVSRPPTCQKIMEHGTSLGVSEFHFFKAELSEKSYLQSAIFNESEKSQRLLQLGLAQSNYYTHMPKVKTQTNFPVLTQEESKLSQNFILSTSPQAKSFHDYSLDPKIPLTLAIGPERGWTMREEKKFVEAGYQPLQLTASILRVEIAIFVVLGQWHLHRYTQPL